jgi:TolB-like protein/Flp pilus assembly protein TadD
MIPGPSFIDRLKKRKIFQWAVAYLAGAWAVLEVVGYVGDQFGWPVLLGQILIVLAGFGFLVLLVLAWYHGEKGRQRMSGAEVLVLALLLFVAGAALSRLHPYGQGSSPSPAVAHGEPAVTDRRPSVAVLPFENLSIDPSDAYLADAIHDELITQLYKIGGLRPISRTSVMGYREPTQTVREIARELGVGSIVQGTVQQVRNRVLVTAQLIDPATDDHLWADEFDREISLDNLFDIKAEITQRIADALRAKLSPAEDAILDLRATENLEAWQAYRTGQYFAHLPHYTEQDIARAMLEFERAVALDSTFALAWMELANTHAQEVFYWTDASAERRDMAKEAADRAMSLNSPLPEVRLAQGLYHLWLERDTKKALEEIARAEVGMPNNQQVYEARAAVFEVQGRFEEAIEEYRKAEALSPRDASVLASLSWDLCIAGQGALAEQVAREAMTLAPDQLWPNLFGVLIIWMNRGETEESRFILESLPRDDAWVTWGRFWQEMMGDHYEKAIRVLHDPEFEWIRLKMWARPRPLLEAQARRALGQKEEAARLFQEARVVLERETAAYPEDPRYHSSLGLALAGLGQYDEAEREVKRAIALLPLSADAWYALSYPWDLTAVYAMAGNVEGAVRETRHLLSIPSFVRPTWIERDFRLDDIRDKPLFQELTEAAGGG